MPKKGQDNNIVNLQNEKRNSFAVSQRVLGKSFPGTIHLHEATHKFR